MLHAMSRRVRVGLVLATVTLTGLTACSPTASSRSSPTAPGLSLDLAINAVLNAPNFTLVTKESGTEGSAAFTTVVTTVTTWVIERPDKILLEGASGVGEIIAIGSTRYSEDQPGQWSELNHQGEPTNYTNAALQYLHILLRASSVARHGTTFVVPSADAKSLLTSTGLTQYQDLSKASLSATVQAGMLVAIRLAVKEPSPYSMTATISRVGTSPAITAPSVSSSG
jgi:hypothetical protein